MWIFFLVFVRNGILFRKLWQRKQRGSFQRPVDLMCLPSIRRCALVHSCNPVWMRAVLCCCNCCRDPKILRSIIGSVLFMFEMSLRHKFCSLRLLLLLVDTSAQMGSYNFVILLRKSPNFSHTFQFTGLLFSTSFCLSIVSMLLWLALIYFLVPDMTYLVLDNIFCFCCYVLLMWILNFE